MAPVFHKYEVPSDAVKVVVSPKQKVFPFEEEIEAVNGFGSAIVTEALAVHPFASVTVNSCVPADRFVCEGEKL